MLSDWFDPQGRAGVDMSDVLEENHRQSDRSDARSLEDREGKASS